MENAPARDRADREPTYEAVWPLGPRGAAASTIPAALPDLNGKTVAFLWDYLFKGDAMYDLLTDELAKEYPDVRFVGYETFGNIHGSNEIELLETLPDALRAHEVDAAVVAVAA
jgi:hypothetical protein